MGKVILRCKHQTDPYSGEMEWGDTEYNGIPEACSMWASGYKHGFLEECSLWDKETGLEIPDRITDKFYDRYYYGRYVFDDNGEEVGHSRWTFVHFSLYFGGYGEPQVNPKKTGILVRR